MAISECIWKKRTLGSPDYTFHILCITRLYLVQSKGLNGPRRKNGKLDKLDLLSNIFQHKTITAKNF